MVREETIKLLGLERVSFEYNLATPTRVKLYHTSLAMFLTNI